jgi:hypothetical protein
MEISQEVFEQQRRPQFGTANPERMSLAFWAWMIRRGRVGFGDSLTGLEKFGYEMRNGMLESADGERRSRDEGPIWSFDRFGATKTRLPDGRVVCIAGEHEDSYAADFCIYNDVVVLTPDDRVEIYGYPKEVFPPTDFHTSTLAGDRIIVIGSLGYKSERRIGHTPVYELSLAGYRISEIKTSGDMPGWISEHRASLNWKGVVKIRRGQILNYLDGKQRLRRNYDDFALDTKTWVWQRLTNRKWREFSIRREKGAFIGKNKPKPQDLFPTDVDPDVMQCKDKEDARIIVEGIPVSITICINCIQVVVEGNMPDERVALLAETIRANAEAAVQSRCILEWV